MPNINSNDLKTNTLVGLEIQINFNRLNIEQLQLIVDKLDQYSYDVNDYSSDSLIFSNSIFIAKKNIKSVIRVVEMQLPNNCELKISENFISLTKFGTFDMYQGMREYIGYLQEALNEVFAINPLIKVEFVTIKKTNNIYFLDRDDILKYISEKYTNLLPENGTEINLNIENAINLENGINGKVNMNITTGLISMEGASEEKVAYQVNFSLEYGTEYSKAPNINVLIEDIRKINHNIFIEYITILKDTFFVDILDKANKNIIGINKNAR